MLYMSFIPLCLIKIEKICRMLVKFIMVHLNASEFSYILGWLLRILTGGEQLYTFSSARFPLSSNTTNTSIYINNWFYIVDICEEFGSLVDVDGNSGIDVSNLELLFLEKNFYNWFFWKSRKQFTLFLRKGTSSFWLWNVVGDSSCCRDTWCS